MAISVIGDQIWEAKNFPSFLSNFNFPPHYNIISLQHITVSLAPNGQKQLELLCGNYTGKHIQQVRLIFLFPTGFYIYIRRMPFQMSLISPIPCYHLFKARRNSQVVGKTHLRVNSVSLSNHLCHWMIIQSYPSSINCATCQTRSHSSVEIVTVIATIQLIRCPLPMKNISSDHVNEKEFLPWQNDRQAD